MSNPTGPCVASTLSNRWGVQQCKCGLVLQGVRHPFWWSLYPWFRHAKSQLGTATLFNPLVSKDCTPLPLLPHDILWWCNMVSVPVYTCFAEKLDRLPVHRLIVSCTCVWGQMPFDFWVVFGKDKLPIMSWYLPLSPKWFPQSGLYCPIPVECGQGQD